MQCCLSLQNTTKRRNATNERCVANPIGRKLVMMEESSLVGNLAAIENRKVLDSRKNGEWNVKLGLTLLAITIVLTTQKLLLLSLKVFEEVYFYRG